MNLQWDAAAGASGYDVFRNGAPLMTVAGTGFLDIQVSSGQAYSYSVVACEAYGVASPVSLYVQTIVDSADLAYLPTKDGPAICGRAGDQTHQALVCNVNRSNGWVSVYSSANDWGYASDRSWIANTDGTVSYCRRVGTGNQALCDRFDGTTWSQSMSPPSDFGYPDTFG